MKYEYAICKQNVVWQASEILQGALVVAYSRYCRKPTITKGLNCEEFGDLSGMQTSRSNTEQKTRRTD
jgi:hypothetical protein